MTPPSIPLRKLALGLLLPLPLLLSGCAVLAVGAMVGAAAFVEGHLVGQAAGNMYETVEATKAAAQRLRLSAVEKTGDESGAKMVAFDPYGNRVAIRLIPESPRTTKVKIRINQFGDEAYSRRILTEIQQGLP